MRRIQMEIRQNSNRSSALVYLVRISDSHSDGPGSIPGRGTFSQFSFFQTRTKKVAFIRQGQLIMHFPT